MCWTIIVLVVEPGRWSYAQMLEAQWLVTFRIWLFTCNSMDNSINLLFAIQFFARAILCRSFDSNTLAISHLLPIILILILLKLKYRSICRVISMRSLGIIVTVRIRTLISQPRSPQKWFIRCIFWMTAVHNIVNIEFFLFDQCFRILFRLMCRLLFELESDSVTSSFTLLFTLMRNLSLTVFIIVNLLTLGIQITLIIGPMTLR